MNVSLRSGRWIPALIAGMLLMSSSAEGQSQRPGGQVKTHHVIFKNNAATCAWITFTGPPEDNVFGDLAKFSQIKGSGDKRKETGPLFVPAGQEFKFILPRRSEYRMRAEVAKTDCAGGYDTGSDGGGTIFDTSTSITGTSDRGSTIVQLHKGNGNYYLKQ